MQRYSPSVRFADIDIMGHVNNAVYLSYLEEARIHFFRQKIGEDWDWKKDGIILARYEIDYKLPVFLHDKIEVETKCSRLGNKSLDLEYHFFRIKEDSKEELVCQALSVLVCFDHQQQVSTGVPEAWRKTLPL